MSVREAQTARMLATADREAAFDWDKYTAQQIAARDDFLVRLDALGARIAAFGDALDAEAMRNAMAREIAP